MTIVQIQYSSVKLLLSDFPVYGDNLIAYRFIESYIFAESLVVCRFLYIFISKMLTSLSKFYLSFQSQNICSATIASAAAATTATILL